ncbi:amidohydrolase [Leucothrix sargassi]|nr:amidohydrolase [Leucothrix sargassi]
MKHLLLLALGLASSAAIAQDMPIFDAHIHYSHDAVIQVPPKEAAAILRKAGLKKAMVSSSDDYGTQAIYKEAPEIVVRALRPYRNRGEINTWVNDPTVITYLESRLAKFEYEAIGEFHAYGADIEKPVLKRMIALAKKHNLLLHAHSDADAVDRIFKAYPEARVLWAHSGFDRPEDIRAMLRKHKNLWSDLAFRNDHASNGKVAEEWRAAFMEFPDRFMVGTDTFAPERWYYINSHAEYTRGWLKDLPESIAHNIAYKNAEKMLSLENEK